MKLYLLVVLELRTIRSHQHDCPKHELTKGSTNKDAKKREDHRSSTHTNNCRKLGRLEWEDVFPRESAPII